MSAIAGATERVTVGQLLRAAGIDDRDFAERVVAACGCVGLTREAIFEELLENRAVGQLLGATLCELCSELTEVGMVIRLTNPTSSPDPDHEE